MITSSWLLLPKDWLFDNNNTEPHVWAAVRVNPSGSGLAVIVFIPCFYPFFETLCYSLTSSRVFTSRTKCSSLAGHPRLAGFQLHLLPSLSSREPTPLAPLYLHKPPISFRVRKHYCWLHLSPPRALDMLIPWMTLPHYLFPCIVHEFPWLVFCHTGDSDLALLFFS